MKVEVTVPKVNEYHDVAYSQIKEHDTVREMHMSLLVPNTDVKKPAVIYFPGGGFTSANYHKFIQMRTAIAQRGIVVAAAEYRAVPDAFPAILNDGKNALAYIRDNAKKYGVDPGRIAVMGDSAGGYLAQFVGTTAEKSEYMPDTGVVANTTVSAVVSLYGISDLLTIGKNLNADFHKSTTSTEALLVNGVSFGEDTAHAITDVEENAKFASPIDHVKKGLAPFLLMHGDSDTIVSPYQAEEMEARLKENDVPVDRVTIEGADHATVEWYQPQVINYVCDWLVDKLF
ncbi:alpha/beta hydrolase [Companilactobacillus hulinensis]|uniref:alpha/beta hydrolase n=1 Tax=Companilactobacillus hulinensis TaxID=2486007 RepID=UPI0013DE0B76|nr:alpha/beta hydrolase [Companilactobacillus hulinensis]